MSSQDGQAERDFAAKAKQAFHQSVQSLDGETRSRLARARAQAVEAAKSRRFNLAPWGFSLAPIGAVAAAALALAVIWQLPSAPEQAVEAVVISDLDLLLDEEDLGMIEDLDFYAWLLEQPEFEADELAGGSG